MDPIHPIAPRPSAIPPVAGGQGSNPGARAAEERREQQRRERARRERERRAQRAPSESPYSADDVGSDAPPRHIDVRA